MKKLLMLIIVIHSFSVYAQVELPYNVGEYSKFKISFGALDVGYANLQIVEQIYLGDKSTFHVVGKGRTSRFFDWFFKVRDVYETFIDTSTLLPIKFNRDISEGDFFLQQKYKFFHEDTIVETQDSIFHISNHSQDMLSALFFARTFEKSELKKRRTFNIPIFMDNENYNLEIEYLNDEVLKTEWGEVECMVFRPKMQEGRVFKEEEQMKVWITKDQNKLLMKVETDVWAGKIRAILIEYKNIKKPF